MDNLPNSVETLPKILIAWVGCTNVTDNWRQTDDRQTDGRRHIANMNMSSRSLKISQKVKGGYFFDSHCINSFVYFLRFHLTAVRPASLQPVILRRQDHSKCPLAASQNKMLSYRRETTLQGALQFSPKVEEWNWETIFYGHYRSTFNHCDIIGLKICRIPWKKTQNKGYYGVQGHSRSSR